MGHLLEAGVVANLIECLRMFHRPSGVIVLAGEVAYTGRIAAERVRILPCTGGYYGMGFPYFPPGDRWKNSAASDGPLFRIAAA
jgi:hypothetical protein